MRRFKGVATVALLMGMFLAGGLSVDRVLADTGPFEPAGTVTVTMAGPCDMMFSEVHQQRYLTYLAKEFDPAALPDWEKAFADRKVASDKFEQMLKSSPRSVEITLPEGAPLQNGEVKIEMEPGQAVEGKRLFTTSYIGAADSDQFNTRIQVQKEFETAVENNDPAAIKNVLPKVLAGYRQATEDMLKAVVSAN